MSVDLEFEYDLKVFRRQRKARPKPTHLMRSILSETDVTIGIDDSVCAKIPEFVLEVGVNIGSVDGVRAEGNDCVRVHFTHLDVLSRGGDVGGEDGECGEEEAEEEGCERGAAARASLRRGGGHGCRCHGSAKV